MTAMLGTQQKEHDWKEKYYQSLDKLDDQEKLLASNEQDLTKFIIKLTRSHSGSSPEFDKTLKKFRDDLYHCKDREKRKGIIEHVVDEIIKFTDKPATTEQDADGSLIMLLDKLDLGKQYKHEIEQLKQKLQQSKSADERKRATQNVCQFINDAHKELQTKHGETQPGTIETRQDDFAEFLNRLSLPGETGIEIRRLRQRINSITEDSSRLEIIDVAVETLQNVYKNLDGEVEQNNQDFEVVLQLLEWITIPENCKTEFTSIKQDIDEQEFNSNPTKTLRKIGDFISRINNNLQSELAEMETYLAKVISRLKEFEGHLIGSIHFQEESLAEAQTFNFQIRENAEKLKQDIDSCQDINDIKIALDSHLEIIDANLDIRLKSEQERQIESQKAIESLAKRVVQIESESQKLQTAIIEERQKAHKDALTGIANRLAYEEKMQDEFSRWQRYQNSLSMGLIDIDDFKQINDQYGHSAGDKVLKTVAKLCEDKIRNIDFIARYGGEEFVLVFPNTNLDESKIAADNIRRAIEKCVFHYNKKAVPITVSIGIAEFQDADTVDDVFERADMALYTAKDSGKNCCKTS